jgi:hypothetical protein
MQGYECNHEASLLAVLIPARVSLAQKDELLTRINTLFEFYDLRLLNLGLDRTLRRLGRNPEQFVVFAFHDDVRDQIARSNMETLSYASLHRSNQQI